MKYESGKPGEENGYNRRKIKEIGRATIDRSKEEDEERVARITDLVTERIEQKLGKDSRRKRWREKRQKKIKTLKRMMENKERRERKNNLVIKGLKGKEKKNLIESAQKCL